MSKHELTFEQAKEAVINDNVWAQGDKFANGVVLMMKGSGTISGSEFLHLHSFNKSINDNKLFLNPKTNELAKSIQSQKYRIVKTQPEALENLV